MTRHAARVLGFCPGFARVPGMRTEHPEHPERVVREQGPWATGARPQR